VGQLLLPDLPRMGVFHDDYVFSTSLTAPPATLWAVAAWALLAIACVVLLRWRAGQLAVCGVLVFLVGHALESTVFSLELYFEHRNYLPGLGLFLLVLAALGGLAARWPQCATPLLAWMSVWLLLLAAQTGSQVQVWSSAPLLRLNHVTWHPDSFRANEEMAVHLASVGALDAALQYSRRAGELGTHERRGDRQLREIAMHCLTGTPVPPERFRQLGTADPRRPFAVVTNMHGVAQILRGGTCDPAELLALADRMAEIFLAEGARATASANYYRVLAGMENDLARFDNAYAYMDKSLALKPGWTVSLLMQLHFATALGKSEEVAQIIEQLDKKREKGRLNKGQLQTLELYR
ncbi:MAG: hypothetical protein R3228_17535, partial [Halioglobus sp.]|nr:hypothetical protein [Halioglobus sp.]